MDKLAHLLNGFGFGTLLEEPCAARKIIWLVKNGIDVTEAEEFIEKFYPCDNSEQCEVYSFKTKERIA
jgi:hypothetical protein